MSNGLRFLTRDQIGLTSLASWGVSSWDELDTDFGRKRDGIHRPDNEADRLLAELDGHTVASRGQLNEEEEDE